MSIVSSGPKVALVYPLQPGGLGDSALRGFGHQGVQVTPVAYPTMAPEFNVDSWMPRLHVSRIRGTGFVLKKLMAMVRPIEGMRLVSTLKALAPDIVLFIKCDDIHPRTYRAIRRACGKNKVRLAAFHPDDPWNTGQPLSPGPSHARAVTQIGEMDVMFLWSHQLVARALEVGAPRSEYLPFACDPELHPCSPFEEGERERYGADVCFVGNWDEERERGLSTLAQMNVDLALWGGGYWSTRCSDPGLRDAWRGRGILGDEMAKVIRASKININVLREQNKDACNMRTFEIPCSGGFMLHERSAELAPLFEPGVHCDDFGSSEELQEKVRYYLEHDEERIAIAARGQARALEQTYGHWAQQVIDVML